jgi:mitochondrial fission protein ELM1
VTPRVWVLLGHRPGDNAQLLALAEELGLPFETRSLRYNFLHPLTGRYSPPGCWSLKRTARQRSLGPPWPNVIIAIGRRVVPVARWIRQQSRGRTRLVQIGNPRVDPRHLDLVFTTRQYLTLAGPTKRLLPVAMSRFRAPPRRTAAEAAWLSRLPRPHLLLMIGGNTTNCVLTPGHMVEVAERLLHRARNLGGGVIAAGSARTDQAVLTALAALSEREPRLALHDGAMPRFAVLVDDADELYPTADSVSMLSEAIITGKPVGMVDADTTEGLTSGWRRRIPRRDLRRFWAFLLAEGLVGTIEAPIASQMPNPVIAAAADVRELLKRDGFDVRA